MQLERVEDAVGIGNDREERRIAEIEQAGETDDDVEPERKEREEHHVHAHADQEGRVREEREERADRQEGEEAGAGADAVEGDVGQHGLGLVDHEVLERLVAVDEAGPADQPGRLTWRALEADPVEPRLRARVTEPDVHQFDRQRPGGQRHGVRRIGDLGFAVEIWDHRNHDVAALATTGVNIGSMTGYLEGGLADEAAGAAYVRTARICIEVAQRLGCPRLNLHGTSLDPRGLPITPVEHTTGPMWITALRTLERLGELGERHDVTFMLENLNTAVDHPRTPFAKAADTLDLVRGVDSPHLRLNLDLYHAQIGEGNLIELCREALPWLAEVQVADVPGRCEPGTGEIRYAGVARTLADAGFTRVVGLEAFARADPAQRDALTQFYIAYSFYRQGWGRFYADDVLFAQGLEAVDRAIALAPGGRLGVEHPSQQIRTADELRAELEAGLRRDASDFNPSRVFRERR